MQHSQNYQPHTLLTKLLSAVYSDSRLNKELREWHSPQRLPDTQLVNPCVLPAPLQKGLTYKNMKINEVLKRRVSSFFSIHMFQGIHYSAWGTELFFQIHQDLGGALVVRVASCAGTSRLLGDLGQDLLEGVHITTSCHYLGT
jgi:hypothetical protein